MINNPFRLIGVDKPALDRQTAEKKERLAADDERNAAYGRESNKNAKLGLLYEQRQERDERDLAKRINEFRFEHQTKESRREWDLNDPESKKNSAPVRVADVDTNLGISSAQVFDGEDLAGPSRNFIQQDQRRQWAGNNRHLFFNFKILIFRLPERGKTPTRAGRSLYHP